MITRLGADEFGLFIYNWLRGEGVDVSHVKFDPERPTGIYFVQRNYPIPGVSDVLYYRRGSAASALGPRMWTRTTLVAPGFFTRRA